MTKPSPIIPPGTAVEDFTPKPEDGSLRRMKVIWDDREKSSALGRTGGFLYGFTHTLNPAVGCVFASTWCGVYCYAQWETPARMIAEQLGLRWGEYLLVKKRIAQALDRDLARAARRDPDHEHHVRRLKVFLSSVTEPCAGPALEVTRECLAVFGRYPIGRVVLQTRSPNVLKLLPELKALGDRVVTSFTVESDSDEIWQRVNPPMLPRLSERRKAVAQLHENGIATSVTVSPCARLLDPEEFAAWIASNASYAVVDTFVAGDGRGGTRTAKTEAPSLFAEQGWVWNDESAARALYEKLRARIGDRAGWSKEGFNRLGAGPPEAR
jgi:DNA repair photolyase